MSAREAVARVAARAEGRVRTAGARRVEPDYVERARTRAAKLDVRTLIDWCENTGSGTVAALFDFLKGKDEGLDEALMGARCMVVVLEEIENRRSLGTL